MKYVVIRSQLVLVSAILFATLAMMLSLVTRFNSRWDFTREKMFSLSQSTQDLLNVMKLPVELIAFYPQDDPGRANFEIFLKQCQMHHSNFKYSFFDADRVPSLANQYHVKDHYTVIIKYDGRQERIVGPTEESFTNALLKLSNPKKITLCFITGHGEASLSDRDRGGYSFLYEGLIDNNYDVHEIILSRDKIPETCSVVVVAGPHRDLDQNEYDLLKSSFEKGKGILFLVDPMDPGTGKSFSVFFKEFGIELGQDVIVDKMSRMVGGDFLVAFVEQYIAGHPITDEFSQPTFFPVTRSVQPSADAIAHLEVVPLAMSGPGSWAEKNLMDLEKGDAAFESTSDVSGPVPIAVAVEETAKDTKKDAESSQSMTDRGRMVVIGDSDFLTNAYLDLSVNQQFLTRSIQWLCKDDRYISVRLRKYEFRPLFLTNRQRVLVLSLVLGALPAAFFLAGAVRVLWRRKSS